jgi:hypothetical protein
MCKFTKPGCAIPQCRTALSEDRTFVRACEDKSIEVGLTDLYDPKTRSAAKSCHFPHVELDHHQSNLCQKHELQKSIAETNKRIAERLKQREDKKKEDLEERKRVTAERRKIAAKEKRRVVAEKKRRDDVEKKRRDSAEKKMKDDEDKERRMSKSASKNASIGNLISN